MSVRLFFTVYVPKLFFAHEYGYRCAVEVPAFTYLVLQETTVWLLDPLRQITEEDEGGDYGFFEHGHIFYFHEFSLVGGGRCGAYHLKHISVELRGGNYAVPVLVHLDCLLYHLIDTLLGECGTEDYREVGKGGEARADGLLHAFLTFQAFILGYVPLVDAYHEPFLVALYEGEDVGVLRLDASCGIYEQDAHIRVLYGSDRADYGVVLYVLVHLLLLAYACGVHQIEVETELVVPVIDRVSGGARDVCDYMTLLSYEGVYNGGFTGVRASYDGESGHARLRLLFFLLRQILDDDVQEVAGAESGRGGHIHRVSKAEGIELRHIEAGIVDIAFIGHQDYRFPGTPQYLRHMVIQVRDTVGSIHHEEDYIRFVHRHVYLLVYFLLENILGVHHPAAGVDNRELPAAPVHLAVLSVARGAGRGVYYCGACLRQAVEEGGLAYIGASYYRY